MQENTVEWLLLEKNEQGMDALLLHYGPLMRYIIAPILQNPQDREDCLSEVYPRARPRPSRHPRRRCLKKSGRRH